MQFIDLKKQHERIRQKIEQRMRKVLDHGLYIMGPEIQELEKKLAEYCAVPFSLAVGSGTEALFLCLLALEIRPEDAVFVPSFTFIATAEVVSLIGARPVFVDIDERTYNLSPQALEEEIIKIKKSGKFRPRGIIAVDIFGQPADYDSLNKLAEKYELFLLEDAAQSFGACYHGRRSCSLAPIAATSFFPAKPLGAYGDAGMIFTFDEQLYKRMVSLRIHGQGIDKYHNDFIGFNARMDTIQAAILLAKLEIFSEELQLRQQVAQRYNDLLQDLVQIPFIEKHNFSSWAQYAVCHPQRDEIIRALTARQIPSAIYYPIPLHLQKAFSRYNYQKGMLPITEKICEQIFALPFHPYLSFEDQKMITETIQQVVKNKLE